MNTETEKRNPILECGSAVAGDKSRFIDADDIGLWFAKMMIDEINTFINIFKDKNIIRNDMANDWENTIKFICRPTIKEITALRKFWKISDNSQRAWRETQNYNNDVYLPSQRRQLWFNCCDGGEIYKRKINEEKQRAWMNDRINGSTYSQREYNIFRGLIQSDYHWACANKNEYEFKEITNIYFKRMASELCSLRLAITANFGWRFHRGVRLVCFGYDVDSGAGFDNTDYLFNYLEEHSGVADEYKKTMILWANALMKRKFMIKINKSCLKAIYNPHTHLGKKWGEKLYNDNFTEE
tara:strand:- start:2211 stop:3101 length:891 start_codon:yes stop_codon:yes gene_type:complete